MATKPLNIYDAKTQFSELIERARAGEEIIIAKNGRPVARLGPLAKAKIPKRVPGRWRGKKGFSMADDFDAPLADDVLRLFGSEP